MAKFRVSVRVKDRVRVWVRVCRVRVRSLPSGGVWVDIFPAELCLKFKDSYSLLICYALVANEFALNGSYC